MTPAINQALMAMEAATARLENAASKSSSVWSWLIGAESTDAALRSQAIAARKLYDAMKAKAPYILQGSSEEYDFILTISQHVDTSEAERLASMLTVSGAVKNVGNATVQDIAKGVKIGIPIFALVALAIGAIYLTSLLPRRANR